MKIPGRLPGSIAGLRDMVEYINHYTPVKNLEIVEIGSWTGISTCIFAERFKYVVAVDPYLSMIGGISDRYNMEDVLIKFKKQTKRFTNIDLTRDKSLTVASGTPEDFVDVVYIDGLHTYEAVKADILAWLPKIQKGGWITGHDWCAKFPGVEKAVKDTIGIPDKIFKDSSWVKRVAK